MKRGESAHFDRLVLGHETYELKSCVMVRSEDTYARARRPVDADKLKQLVFQSHVGLGLKTDAGTEDVSQGTTLFGQRIDHWCAWRGQRSLYKCQYARIGQFVGLYGSH